MTKMSIISAKTLRQELRRPVCSNPRIRFRRSLKKSIKKRSPASRLRNIFTATTAAATTPRVLTASTLQPRLTCSAWWPTALPGRWPPSATWNAIFRNGTHRHPIAPLMHLEERKGKLTLVLEKALVDIDSVAMQVFKAIRRNGWRPPRVKIIIGGPAHLLRRPAGRGAPHYPGAERHRSAEALMH